MKNGKQPTINGTGSFSRDFTYIDNVVHANCLAMLTKEKRCFGDVFNIGAGGRVSILELFLCLKKSLNFDKDPVYGEERQGDIPHSNANILKATLLLNYRPIYDFDQSIGKTVEYFLSL